LKKACSILSILLGLFLLPLFLQAQVIVTVAGTGLGGYDGDGGPATNAKLHYPVALAFDKDGNLYVTDEGVYRVRKIDPAGIITTIAGTGTYGYCCDGGPAVMARIGFINGIAADQHGNIYLADGGGSHIRKITTDGIIHTIAGTGATGYNGDGIPATDAEFNGVVGVAIDDTGNVYACDIYNYRIRKISPGGIITTIAGTGIDGFTPDGARADTSAIGDSYCVQVDISGNVFFKDKDRIRKIASGTGILTTIAGNGTSGYSGDGGAATNASISTAKFAVDTSGNLYLGEETSKRVRKVNTEGGISTIAGCGVTGFDGEGISALLAKMSYAIGVAIHPDGEVYFADKGNSRVRRITYDWVGVQNEPIISEDLHVFPNPARSNVSLQVITTDKAARITVKNATGAVVYEQLIPANKPVTIAAPWPAGVYMVTAATESKTITRELIVQ
jgi:sugar lactone lactonase YvrE